ncbi:MAG: DNA topoisomerase III [Chthoniobacteraceae bacterium]
MSKTLVIAEKPSVATDLAKALGVRKAGEWYEDDKYVISSAVGHLFEIQPPDGFEPKGKWSFFPSLPPHFELKVIDKNANRATLLRKLLKRKDVTAVVNACDAGREGELIFRNIMRGTGAKQPSQRLWLQSMTLEAIRNAFAHLRSDADMLPLSDAALSRSESDWLVGINSTRALTKLNTKAMGGFQKTTAGRVQTPTLAILAEREERIRKFESRPYFEVFGDFGVAAGSYRGRWFDPAFRKGADEDARAERMWERTKADAIATKCTGKPATVEEEKKPTSQISPQLYDLTTLQREANQRFGFPARMTLSIAQALYEKHKALTYPRTDSRYLPEDHLATAKQVLAGFEDPSLSVHAMKALNSGWVHPNKRIFNNAKVSDHFAIVPTGTAPRGLQETEQKIFDLVARRFIAVFFPAAQFEVTTRITTVEGEKFKTDGKIIVDPGWMAVYGRVAEGEDGDRTICPLAAGETSARTEAIEVKENMTKPPARFSEATLLSAMEGAGKLVDDEELREAMSERGLGTPATRAQTIEGLIYEGYITRQGRELKVTAKGLSLITLLRDIDASALTKPELTGEWEFKLRQMERGELSRATFMDGIRDLTTEIVRKISERIGSEVGGRFEPLLVKCPRCGGETFNESFRAFECANPECKLIVWKTMSDREFEREEVAALLTTCAVGPLDGFKSRFGKPFSAPIVLNEKTEWKAKFDFGDADGAASEPINPEPLGKCRACEAGQVFEHEKAFICDQFPAKKCTFRLGKTMLQRTITREEATVLVATGKSPMLHKFISNKTKRAFSAFLKLGADGKVSFEFEPREKKPPKTKAATAPASTPPE